MAVALTACGVTGSDNPGSGTNTITSNDSSAPPSAIRPTSGLWHFTSDPSDLTLSGASDTCHPPISGLIPEDADAMLDVTPDGLSADLFIPGGENFILERVDEAVTLYRSFAHYISTGTALDTLSIWLEFTAITQESLEGTISWETSECSGSYPSKMTLTEPTETQAYIPVQGGWNLQYTGMMLCGASIIMPSGFVTLSIPTDGLGSMQVTGGGPDPLRLNFHGSTGSFDFLQESDSNYYHSGGSYLGTAITLTNPSDPVVNIFMESGHLYALSENFLQGVLRGYCSPGGDRFNLYFAMSSP